MKKLITLLFLAVLPFCHKAAGWPAYYGGVILQGFYWDSYDDTGWNKFMEQADDLTDAFDLIWIPNSGRIDDFGTARAMGYTPVYWFDHNTIFGSENELRTMIRTFHERGTGFIMDCVLNHKNGATDWVTFANEKVTGPYSGRTFQVMWDNEKYSQICQDDECNYNGYKTTGAKDTGENFDGARDLDHTNATTQHNVKVYQDFLLNELGYAGWRLDETKGFSPYYAGLYNYASKPMFSVGEYWDGNSDVLRWWLESTKINDQIQSATFDFCLKYRINEACNNGSWGALNDKGLAADANYSRWAVTFLDNHDTGRDGYQKVSANVGAANAIILALPGTPCIYYPHWKNYKTQILNCIKGRRAAGVNNMSSITKQEESNGGYIIEVQGTKGKVYLQLGPATGNGTPSGFQLVQSGTNYRFYVSSGLNWKNAPKNSFLPADPNPTEFPASDKVTILVKADDPISGRIYAWDNNDKPIGNPWPGTVLATLPHTMVGGAKWYYKVFDQSTVNVILNNSYDGTGNQTADIKGLKGTVFLNYPTNNSKYENVTTKYTPYIGYEIPEIATKVEGKVYAYLETNDYSAPCAYAWGILDQKFSGKWPGTKMTQVGTAPNGKKVFLWTGDDLTAENMPSNIIFNDGKTTGAKQTADLEFINGGYYTIDGLIAAIPGSELPKENEDVFILGEVNNNGGWYPNVGTQMFTKDGITYTANITTTGSNGGYSYFSFSKKLAQAGEGWDAINRYRFGARTDEENLLVTDELLGQELPLDVDGSQKAFQIVAGTWNLTLNLSTRTLVVSYPEELVGDFDSSGCVDIVDLTILINTILDGSTSDFYDVNGDNEVDVRDVTALIALILQ